MALIERIRHLRDVKQCDERSLLSFAFGWTDEESKGAGKIYTSAEVSELLGEILGTKADSPAAATARESEEKY